MLVLASSSPRRSQILQMAGLPFRVVSPDADEICNLPQAPADTVMELAGRKASAVDAGPEEIVVGADTLVVLDGTVMGKPSGPQEAKQMLCRLSGRVHQVYTGVCLKKGEKIEKFYQCSHVEFFPLSGEEIDAYVDTKEPLDKAGAYGIQGKGALLVKEIRGDFYSVMGLPVSMLFQKLKEI